MPTPASSAKGIHDGRCNRALDEGPSQGRAAVQAVQPDEGRCHAPADLPGELEVHTQVEEEIVYPALASIDRPLEKHAEDEHKQAKRLIEQIRSNGSDAGETEALARKLEAAVQEHVQEEESKALPELRQRAADQLDDMGTRVEERKKVLARAAGQ